MLRFWVWLSACLFCLFFISGIAAADTLVTTSGREWDGDVKQDPQTGMYTLTTATGSQMSFPPGTVKEVIRNRSPNPKSAVSPSGQSAPASMSAATTKPVLRSPQGARPDAKGAVVASDNTASPTDEADWFAEVRTLLDRKRTVNGITRLHEAVLLSDIEAVKAQLAKDAATEASTLQGHFTPLFVAVVKDDAAMVELLIRAKANVNAVSRLGTPLHMAFARLASNRSGRRGDARAQIMRLLLDGGADPNLAEPLRGLTALHLAEDADLIHLLLLRGANPNAKAKKEITPLHLAVVTQDRQRIALLLAAGADPSVKSAQGELPLDLMRRNVLETVQVQWDHAIRSAGVYDAIIKHAAAPTASEPARTVPKRAGAVTNAVPKRAGAVTPKQSPRGSRAEVAPAGDRRVSLFDRVIQATAAGQMRIWDEADSDGPMLLRNLFGLVQDQQKDVIRGVSRALIGAALEQGMVLLSDLPPASARPAQLRLDRYSWEWTGTWDRQFQEIKGRPSMFDLLLPVVGLEDQPYEIDYRLNGRFRSFTCEMGLGGSSMASEKAKLTFKVMGDGRQLWASQPVGDPKLMQRCIVDVTGVKLMTIQIHTSAKNVSFDRVAWLNPELRLDIPSRTLP